METLQIGSWKFDEGPYNYRSKHITTPSRVNNEGSMRDCKCVSCSLQKKWIEGWFFQHSSTT